MPLLWRYLLRNYLQVFFLSVAGFISVLLVTRFQDIARFAATGASKLFLLKFILFQIPFILPLAIPISCLIASILLFQKLSRSHELTALRVAGLGLTPIAFPLMVCGCLIAVVNFSLVSEISPKCRAASKELVFQMSAINPLCLLQKKTLFKLKNTYVDMKVLKSNEYAEDVIFIMRSLSNQRLGMMLAKKISLNKDQLMGENVTFISSIDPKSPDLFDHLVIENQAEMETKADQLSQYLRSNEWNLNYDYLNFRTLQAKLASEKGDATKFHTKGLQEIARRISLGFAPVIFTFIGIAFGMEISRDRKKRGLLWAISLTVFFFISFLSAKSFKHHAFVSILCYLIPHLIIFLFCSLSFRRISKGCEQ